MLPSSLTSIRCLEFLAAWSVRISWLLAPSVNSSFSSALFLLQKSWWNLLSSSPNSSSISRFFRKRFELRRAIIVLRFFQSGMSACFCFCVRRWERFLPTAFWRPEQFKLTSNFKFKLWAMEIDIDNSHAKMRQQITTIKNSKFRQEIVTMF